MNVLSKGKMVSTLPYIGLPILGIALLLLKAGRTEAFVLVWHELLIAFGYFAAVLDLKARKVPNMLVLAMLAAWLLTMTSKLLFDTGPAVALLSDSALGFAIGGGMFLLVYVLSRKGLGGGDVKFMAASGLFLGLGGTISSIFIGTVLAALVGLGLILLKRIGRKDPIPLVPFLYAGILVTVFMQ
ncbi:MAG: A24 family peptidase [Oscillospiraceae bacterium]|nr:A24 family peptidase [Oscillospiraceae bacterium]